MIKTCLMTTILVFCTAMPHNLVAAAISFNIYPWLADVKSDSDLTVTTFVPLPAGFSYFSFINFGGLLHSGSMKFQITEQNIIWNVARNIPFDLVLQDTIRNGRDNDTIHAGVRWRLNNTESIKSFFDTLHLSYSFHIFPKRFDQRDVGGWQVSHVYQMQFPYISDRLYFSGFLDHNINERSGASGNRDNIVSENQFGVRMFKQLYAVFEFRINEYRRSDTTNFGAGIELKTNW
jgi:hypothetical protein